MTWSHQWQEAAWRQKHWSGKRAAVPLELREKGKPVASRPGQKNRPHLRHLVVRAKDTGGGAGLPFTCRVPGIRKAHRARARTPPPPPRSSSLLQLLVLEEQRAGVHLILGLCSQTGIVLVLQWSQNLRKRKTAAVQLKSRRKPSAPPGVKPRHVTETPVII